MEGKLQLTKTFRYYTYGNPDKASKIWFVLHGYGQLAFYFLRKFNVLDPDEHFVVAPEGMHRFYLEGTSGRVGASWMTKEARLDDIEDNHNYLDQLSAHFLNNYAFDQRIVLGFSQGGATASRWHAKNTFHADHFILWACVFPPDLEGEQDQDKLKTSRNYFIIGRQDQYFQDHFEEIIDQYRQEIPGIEVIPFDGPHNIDHQTLLNVANQF
ncbi:MAG: alpha/beta hydrolase [Bacteroidota bacterium]